MPRIRQMAWVATEHAERRLHHGPTRGHNRGQIRGADPRRLQWETAATVAAIKLGYAGWTQFDSVLIGPGAWSRLFGWPLTGWSRWESKGKTNRQLKMSMYV